MQNILKSMNDSILQMLLKTPNRHPNYPYLTDHRQKCLPVFPKTSQDFISMLVQDFQGNIFKTGTNTYSISFYFCDVPFERMDYTRTDQNMKSEADIFIEKWREYIQSMQETCHLQISCISVPITDNDLAPLQIHVPDDSPEIHHHLSEEFNQLISERTKSFSYKKEKVITLSLYAGSFEDAQSRLEDLITRSSSYFQNMTSSIQVLTAAQRIEILHDFFNSRSLSDKGIEDPIEWMENQNLTIQDLIAPKGNFYSRNQHLEVKNEDTGERRYIKVFYLDQDDNSESVMLGTDIMKYLMSNTDINLFVTQNIQKYNISIALKELRNARHEANARLYSKTKNMANQNMDYSSFSSFQEEDQKEDTQEFIDELTSYGDVFTSSLLICVTADSLKQLHRDSKNLTSILSGMNASLSPMDFQHLEAVRDLLPLGHNSLQIQHLDTAGATAGHVPFLTREYLDPNGTFQGLNPLTKLPIFIDRRKQLSGHGAVLSTTGGGKSFYVKCQIEQILMKYPEDEIIIIDPQKEYLNLVSNFNGQTIHIANGSPTHINPLDCYIPADETQDNTIYLKSEFMQAFIQSLHKKPLTGPEETAIDFACRKLMEDYYEQKEKNPDLPMPLLSDFLDSFTRHNKSERLQDIAASIERYVTGTVNMYNNPTNVFLDNRLTCFDISGLKESIMTTGYLIVMEYIQNKLIQNRQNGKTTWIFIDEFHVLLRNEYAANYTARITKTARKLNGLVTVITQNIQDVLNNASGTSILSNSQFAVLLKQSAQDIPLLRKQYDLSESEGKNIQSVTRPGQGILIYENEKIPFINNVPSSFKMYQINNTDPSYRTSIV